MTKFLCGPSHIKELKSAWVIINRPISYISHNAPFCNRNVQTCVHIYTTKRCIVGYFSDALWDLKDGSIQKWWFITSLVYTISWIASRCGSWNSLSHHRHSHQWRDPRDHVTDVIESSPRSRGGLANIYYTLVTAVRNDGTRQWATKQSNALVLQQSLQCYG